MKTKRNQNYDEATYEAKSQDLESAAVLDIVS